jgi:hypothetical protein
MSKVTTSGGIVLFVLVARYVCGCSADLPPGASKASITTSNSPIVSGVLTNKPQLSMQDVVDQSELIVTASIRLMAGSRIKNVSLDDVQVLHGVLPVGKELIVTLRYHPLMFSHRKERLIFCLLKPTNFSENAEFRPLVGGEVEPAGLELATEANLEKVRRAIQNQKNGN